MTNEDVAQAFERLSTPLVFDACLSAGIEIRCAPPGVAPLAPNMRAAGRVLPARHAGSVDVFLEAFEGAERGDVLVIDNQGRRDEGCIGDLIALEARQAALAGILVWGSHRDTPELLAIQLPVFSYGACLMGPQRLDPREPDALSSAEIGAFQVDCRDVVFCDADGALFVPIQAVSEVLPAARTIAETESRQSRALADGTSLREQLRFREYLERRARDPSYTLRRHLDEIGGAIEK